MTRPRVGFEKTGKCLVGVWVASLLGGSSVWAAELYELYRGARLQAMGGASIALADDEQAVWRNPAGLAGNKSSRLHLAVADLSLSPDALLLYGESAGAFSKLSLATLNQFLGRDINTRIQLTPTFIFGNFAASILVDQQLAFNAENMALPKVQFGYQTTNGVQLAYGFEVAPRKRRRVKIKLGVAGKMLWRRGGYRTLPTSALLNPSSDQLLSRIGNYGQGYGVDFGSLVTMKLARQLDLQGAFVTTDIGDTGFGDGPQPIRMNVAAGLGLIYQMKGAAKASLLYELRHLNESADIRRKQHLGAELALPVVKLFAGYNQAFLSYGAAVDIFLFRLTAASYTEEIETRVYQNPQTRWMLRVDLKLGL